MIQKVRKDNIVHFGLSKSERTSVSMSSLNQDQDSYRVLDGPSISAMEGFDSFMLVRYGTSLTLTLNSRTPHRSLRSTTSA